MRLLDAGGEISRCKRQGRLERPDPWTPQVLQLAQAVAEQPGGAFDVTVQPLWRLFDRHAARAALPPHLRSVDGLVAASAARTGPGRGVAGLAGRQARPQLVG